MSRWRDYHEIVRVSRARLPPAASVTNRRAQMGMRFDRRNHDARVQFLWRVDMLPGRKHVTVDGHAAFVPTPAEPVWNLESPTFVVYRTACEEIAERELRTEAIALGWPDEEIDYVWQTLRTDRGEEVSLVSEGCVVIDVAYSDGEIRIYERGTWRDAIARGVALARADGVSFVAEYAPLEAPAKVFERPLEESPERRKAREKQDRAQRKAAKEFAATQATVRQSKLF